jgi:hypothetical protein
MSKQITALIAAALALVAGPASAIERWQLNLSPGVTKLSHEIYGLHDFLHLRRHRRGGIRRDVLRDVQVPEIQRRGGRDLEPQHRRGNYLDGRAHFDSGDHGRACDPGFDQYV